MRRLIVDVSSLLWQSLLAGKDKEFGMVVEHEGKEVHVNGWQFGQECAINHLLSVMGELDVVPIETIFVVEGAYSKQRRKAIYNGYKEGRDSRPALAYEQFSILRDKLTQTFRNLGAQIVTQEGVEADDIIAYLARNLDGEKVILTTDGDMATLIGPDVALWRGGMLTRENPYGPFPHKLIPVYKALVGDGNEYKGATRFGPKTFLDFMVWAGEGGLAAIEGMMKRRTLHELADDVAEFKPLKLVIDSAEHVYQSYDCALLHDEWVNTLRQPLEWKAGMVKPVSAFEDKRLHKWAQMVGLVTKGNYGQAVELFKEAVTQSPFFTLDIETSTPEESDEWLIAGDKTNKVDVLGSKLTGLGLTVGRNNNRTLYFSVDHANTANVSSADVLDIIRMIPSDKHIVIQNFAFEGPILYKEWGDQLKDNGWHGFLPNVIDTVFLASYVNENSSLGLKQGSKHYLDYEQQSYADVTTFYDEDGTGRQLKMNQLTAEHVLSYGADDTICTAALFNHFRVRMEIEKTWDLQLQVEQLPSYVMALAYVGGTKFSLQRMKELESEDAVTSAKAWATLRDFLIEQGWEGTVTPQYKELTPAMIKEVCQIVLGEELKTMVRTPSKLAKLVDLMEHADAPLLAQYITQGNLDQINDLVKSRFKGEPELNLGSPLQMRNLLYKTLDLPVRLVNSTTATEREKKPLLSRLVSDHKKRWAGHDVPPAPAYMFSDYPPPVDVEAVTKELLMTKAKTDDTAVDFALALDVEGRPEVAKVLSTIRTMKKCATRSSLFYKPYAHMPHWLDGKIHGQAGQCRTVTRRFAPSDPNLAQLPKKGEGVKFRECFLPHKKGAVVVSVDFAGQELRQGAGQSMDQGMLDCFVGEHKKDMHSMTASEAMLAKWGKETVARFAKEYDDDGLTDYDLFLRLRRSKDPTTHKMADDLRKDGKGCNFAAQYDCQAPKLAETLVIPVPDAQTFLDAKYKAFPRFEEWKEEVKAEAERTGYVMTPLGGRRHLRDSLLSSEWGVKDKALRQGPNFKIQGASAEQTKLAMSELWRSNILFRLDMQFFAPIHDELVWSVAAEDALESIKVVVAAMTKPYGNLPVPFLGSVSLGMNFGAQIECGDEAAENPALLDEIVPQILARLFVKTEATV